MFTKKLMPFAMLVLAMLFSNCSKDTTLSDPCASVTCLNGGTCANGSCNCPTGFTGSDCGTRRIPSRVLITKIEILAFPPTDNGGGWDNNTGPDIFPMVMQGTNVIWDSPDLSRNANSNSTYAFTPSPSLQVNLTTQYAIDVWDYDLDDVPFPSPNDFMGGYLFTPSNYSTYPPTVTLNNSTSDLIIKLYLSYAY
jgi:hypothetical protein